MEKHYHPGSPLSHPVQMMKGMLGDLLVSRELAWRLLLRNIRAQYRQSLFGIIWAFVPPIVMTGTFVFLADAEVLNLSSGSGGLPYPVYVMAGTILWQLFVDALNSPLKLMVSSRQMLAKINFPREALILAGLGEVAFNFLIRLVLLAGLLLCYGVSLPSTLWLAPLGFVAVAGLGLMFGLLLTPIGMLYTDVQNGLMVIFSMWFFVTPVVYAPPTSGTAALISKVNPVSPLLTTARGWLVGGGGGVDGLFLPIIIGTVLLLCFGWVLYRVSMPHLISRIGS